ncbi:ABC transporter permease [Candidatus Enterococcus murrayae]|uniref:ABC transporter permease n=1 Tax=Candidatus Enterococcus murrayae TaxID=2815321 RepID=A0ABS3HDW4_9ENTE|nr:ABC transporter permease [Enterococcus sp. MJM16]MBO0451124.1 ABC transporter permease [Enterococcus sp. MJM16]
MINLISIEWKKNNFRKQVIYVLLSILSIGFLTFLFSSDTITDDSAPVFIDLLVKAFFIIWEGVWISKVIIEEYKSKSVLVLFTTPVRITKVLTAKIILIFLFSASSMVFAQLFLNGVFWGLSINLPMIRYDIGTTDILVYVFSSIMVALFGLLPLAVGMINYSTVATLVTSIILLLVSSNSGMGFDALVSQLSFTIPFGIVGFFSAVITLFMQSRRDVIV